MLPLSTACSSMVSILAILSDDMPWLSGEAAEKEDEFLIASGPVQDIIRIAVSNVKNRFFIRIIFKGLTVLRCDGATVRRCDGTTVRRCDGTTVRRCDGATVRRYDGAMIRH